MRLVRSRGGNTMECEGPDGSVSLYWLPAKFSKVVWAQRGDYLIVEPEDSSAGEAGRDSKVTGTIVQILFPEQVAHLRKLPCWPGGFPKESKRPEGDAAPAARDAAGAVEGGAEAEAGAGAGAGAADSGSDSEDDDDDLFVNNNRNHDDLIDSDDD